MENSPGELWLELLILRNVRLHRDDAERFRRRRNLGRAKSENQNAHNGRHRNGKIKMRSHHACARFYNQSIRGGENDHVDKRNHERQPGNTGELCDLNQRPTIVQRDTEAVPAKAGENPAAQPFKRGPGRREEESESQVACRFRPRRLRRVRRASGLNEHLVPFAYGC